MRFNMYYVFILFFPAVLAQQLYPTPRGSLLGNCSVLVDNDTILGTYDQFSNTGLLPSLFISGDGTSAPFLRIIRSKVTCLNSGLTRGTASSAGILVEYRRQDSPNVNRRAQVAVDCIADPFNPNADFSFYPTRDPDSTQTSAQNTARVSIGSTLQDNVNVPFTTELRTDCAVCTEFGDAATRCQDCIGCNNGSMRCVGNNQQTDQCCSYYLDNICVQFCPSPLVANTVTFDCGCAALNVPNGGVDYSNAQLVGSVATYSCDTGNGYILPDDAGAGTRTCTLSGWTGSDLNCQLHDCKLTGLFNPQNGEFKLQNGLTTFGASATFECLDGYELVGETSRTCTLSGWSGTNPSCNLKVISCPNGCNTGECDTTTGKCECPADKTGDTCLDDKAEESASTGGGCGTPCIIGIVLAVVGAIILVAVVAAVAYGIFSYLNHPDTKMAKFDNENFNGVARDNPLYVNPDEVVGDGAEAA